LIVLLRFSHRHKGNLILALCHALPKEVLDGGMNKYGDPSEKQKFQAWLTYVPSFKLTICVYPDVT
jgi:hypothetical protein